LECDALESDFLQAEDGEVVLLCSGRKRLGADGQVVAVEALKAEATGKLAAPCLLENRAVVELVVIENRSDFIAFEFPVLIIRVVRKDCDAGDERIEIAKAAVEARVLPTHTQTDLRDISRLAAFLFFLTAALEESGKGNAVKSLVVSAAHAKETFIAEVTEACRAVEERVLEFWMRPMGVL
jgi:hypothetical protein